MVKISPLKAGWTTGGPDAIKVGAHAASAIIAMLKKPAKPKAFSPEKRRRRTRIGPAKRLIIERLPVSSGASRVNEGNGFCRLGPARRPSSVLGFDDVWMPATSTGRSA
jgi:hypothetical protein